jgi:hypothetical protein
MLGSLVEAGRALRRYTRLAAVVVRAASPILLPSDMDEKRTELGGLMDGCCRSICCAEQI